VVVRGVFWLTWIHLPSWLHQLVLVICSMTDSMVCWLEDWLTSPTNIVSKCVGVCPTCYYDLLICWDVNKLITVHKCFCKHLWIVIHCEIGPIILSFLQIRKLRFRGSDLLAWVSKWQGQGLNLGNLISAIVLTNILYCHGNTWSWCLKTFQLGIWPGV
jgi:hypothetical protein